MQLRSVPFWDDIDEEGHPVLFEDHARLRGDTKDVVLSYLENAPLLLVTTSRGLDYVDPSRGAVVPSAFRSDGVWVWNDELAYYLREYDLAPSAQFVKHVVERQVPPSGLSAAVADAAVAYISG
jgi:hypothetical protein